MNPDGTEECARAGVCAVGAGGSGYRFKMDTSPASTLKSFLVEALPLSSPRFPYRHGESVTLPHCPDGSTDIPRWSGQLSAFPATCLLSMPSSLFWRKSRSMGGPHLSPGVLAVGGRIPRRSPAPAPASKTQSSGEKWVNSDSTGHTAFQAVDGEPG